MYAFTYHRPANVSGAIADLGDERRQSARRRQDPAADHEAAPRFAGRAGRSRQDRRSSPAFARDGEAIVIGAMTRHAEVASSAAVQSGDPGAWPTLAAGIGDPQVRNRGTIGGSLANNDPAADYPAAALALGATIVTNKREIAADAFFKGLFETALEPGEIITQVRFPIPQKAAYMKFPIPASRYALVGVFVGQDRGRRAGRGDRGGRERRLPRAAAGERRWPRISRAAALGRRHDSAERAQRRHPCRRRLSRPSDRGDGEAGRGRGRLRTLRARIGAPLVKREGGGATALRRPAEEQSTVWRMRDVKSGGVSVAPLDRRDARAAAKARTTSATGRWRRCCS